MKVYSALYVILGILFLTSTALGQGLLDVQRACLGKASDIVFVLDESNSIHPDDFTKKQLKFVKDMVDLLDIAPDRTHVGVITFADAVKDRFSLLAYANRIAIKSAIDRIRQTTGNTYTFDAIAYLRKTSFSRQSGARPGIPHIAIILTDGESHDRARTLAEADQAKREGIEIYAIGIGSKASLTECRDMASDPKSKYYFHVDDYDALRKILQDLGKRACATTTPMPTTPRQYTPVCGGPADVVFALSDNAKSKDFNLQIDFIATLAGSVKIPQDKIQFGVTEKTCSTMNKLNLNDASSNARLSTELERRKFESARPEIQFRKMREFKTGNGARAKVTKFGIIFIDEKLANPEAALTESEFVKVGMKLIVITVGKDVMADEDTMKEFASSADHYFHVPNYASFKMKELSLVHKIKEVICNGVRPGLITAVL